MTDLSDLSTAELETLAKRFRGDALRGERDARGVAHEYESEIRRRTGVTATVAPNLDLRALSERQRASTVKKWWKFW